MTKEEKYLAVIQELSSLLHGENDEIARMSNIACSSESRSEIVVTCRKRGVVTAVLDIDSERLGMFDDVDARYLERVASLVYPEEQNG